MSNLPNRSAITDAYALAYGVFRVSHTLRQGELQNFLENRAIGLILAELEANSAKIQGILRDLEYLTGFGRDVGLIHPQTAEVLLKEIEEFKPEIRVAEYSAMDNSESRVPPALSEKDLLPNSSAIAESNSAMAEIEFGNIFGKEAAAEPIAEPISLIELGSDDKFNLRKNKILEIVRQSGNCRLRDLQEVMGDISERTLRYDLQRLIAEGVLEKVGNSGPATFYRLRA